MAVQLSDYSDSINSTSGILCWHAVTSDGSPRLCTSDIGEPTLEDPVPSATVST
uniref:Uncharacterized protein n=1 Tax=Arundo donax TaxID=35708 RepID=A0A0A9CDK0_ARUDO